MAKKKAAKKKAKRGAPRSPKWVGCEGATADGQIRKGWRPPAAKGQCPRPGKAAKGRRASKAAGCTPMIRKAMDVASKRAYQSCWKEMPSDCRARMVGKVLAAESKPHSKCHDWDEHAGECRDKPAWSAGLSKKDQAKIRAKQRRAGKASTKSGMYFLHGAKKKKSSKKGFFAKLFSGKR